MIFMAQKWQKKKIGLTVSKPHSEFFSCPFDQGLFLSFPVPAMMPTT
jgi:hypothetical protein